MARKTEKEEKAPPAIDPELEEKKRLRALAISKKILRRSSANATAPLEPSKAVVKLQGRDIVKRGQRKSRYLFSFPGLIAPLSGGKIGDLANLATKNPVLYLEFPQGRMKLFGTHVYPKNKYLTLQLTKSTKGVMCEDVFESMIVFSEAQWVGQKEENPEECQLEFPNDLKEGNVSDYDFKGGAGEAYGEDFGGQKIGKEYAEPSSPDNEDEYDGSDDLCIVTRKDVKMIETTPLRQSARASKKIFTVSYAESSDEDYADSDNKAIELDELRIKAEADTKSKIPSIQNRDELNVVGEPVCSLENEAIATKANVYGRKAKQTLQNSTGKPPNKKGPLVQARLSSLFEKMADQVNPLNNIEKKLVGKSGTRSGTSSNKRKRPKEVDDGSEDISSDSQEEDEDEDWAA